MALDLIGELERLTDALDAAGAAYAICGGLALAMHGYPRATIDIDLLVPADHVDRAREVARACGFDVPARKMIFGLRVGRSREVHHLSKLAPDTQRLMTVDLLVVNEELASVWESRVRLQAGPRQMPVVSREGLITMKRIAGRPQDLVDIAKLEGKDDEDAT